MKKSRPSPESLLQEAVAWHQQGDLGRAMQLYEQVLVRAPEHPDVWHLTGIIANQTGRFEEAYRRISTALRYAPDRPAYLVSLANSLVELERFDAAESSLRRALVLAPDMTSAHNNLANLLQRCGRIDDAMREYDATLVLDASHRNALNSLSRLLLDRRQYAPAATLLRRLLALTPQDGDAWQALAMAYYMCGAGMPALEAVDRALEAKPDDPSIWCNRGNVLGNCLHRYEEALAAFHRAEAIDPNNAAILDGLAVTYARVGDNRRAREIVERQLALNPDDAASFSHDLFLLNYDISLSPAELFLAHQRWNRRYGVAAAAMIRAHANAPEPERRLRVGYVSADLRSHSVAYFTEPILRQHDRRRFEVFVYSVGVDTDATTARLQTLADVWRDCATLGDVDLAERIRADGIDILVDLSGHTALNRLRVFALKPAPVQISYLGYPHSTGLTAIDYRITDARADPPGEADRLNSETLLRMPDCFHCYQPVAGLAAPGAPPGLAAGAITFGSFNVLGKISPLALDAWARILIAVPGSRLLLKSKGLSSAAATARLRADFAARGVDSARLVLSPHEPAFADHMARYRDVDIGLDTFPYNGTTTTCEACWMGVPVITVRGDRHAARVGDSLLSAIGAGDLVADDVDGYVDRAVALARDADRLAYWHATLRELMTHSPLIDAPRFVGNLETHYRRVWQHWCGQRGQADDDWLRHYPHWRLNIRGGIEMTVPASFDAMTPYTLLEGEDWFEDEIHFVRRYLQQGMQVIDIGANYGVYSLTAARHVGAAGRVWSFEPAPNTACFLVESARRNGFACLEVERTALSDRCGEAYFELHLNPELNRIVTDPVPEHRERLATVRIDALDDWSARQPDHPAPDFIKLDAEGHERLVLAGAERLLARTSPLIMFELKHGNQISTWLIEEFTRRGYDVFVLVPGLGVLAPYAAALPPDGFLLNLFAAKPETASRLADRGLLVAAADGPVATRDALAGLADRGYARGFIAAWQAGAGEAAEDRQAVLTALGYYATAHAPEASAATRLGALQQALVAMREACGRQRSVARLNTLARIAGELGQRSLAVAALGEAVERLRHNEVAATGEPFLPASPQRDADGVVDPASWLRQLTRARYLELMAFSGYFASPAVARQLLDEIASDGPLPASLERRRQLIDLRAGAQLAPRPCPALAQVGDDNLNPRFWCGAV